MGVSTNRLQGGELIVETTHMAANWTFLLARHSDRLRIVERYIRSSDGKLLSLTATLEDPHGNRVTQGRKPVYRYQKIPNPQGALESARLFLTAHALGSGTPLGPYEAVVAVGAGWMGGWSPRAATLYF
jgi:hypothetical protein